MTPIVLCLAHVISSVLSIDIDLFLSNDALTFMHQLDEERCDKTIGKPRPIHDNKIWAFMREKYEEIIGASESGSNEPSNDYISGFKVKYTINYNENNRRSIFAKENIKKGQVVYQHSSEANFPDLGTLIRFLKQMPTYLLCDTIEWLHEWDDGVFSIDFDDVSYINDEGEMNIDYDDDNSVPIFVALRDIDLGEELIWNVEGGLTWIDSNEDEHDSKTDTVLKELNNCEEVWEEKRPIFGKPLWILMQKIYEEITNETISSNDFGFRVKYSVNYTQSRGRGLFAREKIQKGEIVYEHNRKACLSEETYPEFLNRLALQENKRKAKNQELEPYLDFLNISPAGIICDIDMWLYYDEKHDNYTRLILDLDDMVYCNSAGSVSGANIEYINYNGSNPMHATRDIDAGEEFFCYY